MFAQQCSQRLCEKIALNDLTSGVMVSHKDNAQWQKCTWKSLPLLSTASYDANMKNEAALKCRLAVAPSKAQFKPICLNIIKEETWTSQMTQFLCSCKSPNLYTSLFYGFKCLASRFYYMLLNLVCCQAAPHLLNRTQEGVNHKAVSILDRSFMLEPGFLCIKIKNRVTDGKE